MEITCLDASNYDKFGTRSGSDCQHKPVDIEGTYFSSCYEITGKLKPSDMQ